jgi:hypothetical protein
MPARISNELVQALVLEGLRASTIIAVETSFRAFIVQNYLPRKQSIGGKEIDSEQAA